MYVAEGFPTFIALIQSFSSVDFLVLNKCTFAAESFPTFMTHVRTFSTVNGLLTLSTAVYTQCSFGSGLILEKTQTGQEVLSNLPAGERLP